MDLDDIPEERLTVKFIYRTSEDYKLHYINGAYGGLTPRQDVMCSFFFEYKELPKEEEQILEKGQLKPSTSSTDPEASNIGVHEVLRDMKTGIIMTPHQAELVANWLLEKVAEAKKISKK